MKHIFLFSLLILLVACNSTEKTAKIGSVEVKYARHFRIEQKADYAVLQILQPETGEVERTYALAKKENISKVPADMDKIEVPVKNMAVLSTTHIGMLDALKELDCIKGSTDVNFVANSTVKKGVQSGKIVSFNDETALTPERLLQKEISLVVYSGFGKAFPNEDKLKKLGILALADYDWREEHPLGKAEWIKVFGYLTGKEKEAKAYFSNVEKNYKAMTVKVKNPTVVLVGSLIGDVWYAPAGESYMAHILKDAGTDYLYADEKGTGSCEKTLEQVFKDQQKATVWINAGAVSLSGLKEQQSKYALFRSFQEGKVYCYTHDSNYFWEMSAVNPHWILSDFISITGTGPGNNLHFYQKLKN